MILKQTIAEKKHSLHSKHFRVKLGRARKKCTRPNFYAVKKTQSDSNLRQTLRKRLLRRLKNLKNTMLRGQQDGTSEVYKRICFRTEKLEDNLCAHTTQISFLRCGKDAGRPVSGHYTVPCLM